jgi:hypothetical protein
MERDWIEVGAVKKAFLRPATRREDQWKLRR